MSLKAQRTSLTKGHQTYRDVRVGGRLTEVGHDPVDEDLDGQGFTRVFRGRLEAHCRLLHSSSTGVYWWLLFGQPCRRCIAPKIGSIEVGIGQWVSHRSTIA